MDHSIHFSKTHFIFVFEIKVYNSIVYYLQTAVITLPGRPSKQGLRDKTQSGLSCRGEQFIFTFGNHVFKLSFIAFAC